MPEHFADRTIKDGWPQIDPDRVDQEGFPRQAFGKPWRQDIVVAQAVLVGAPEAYSPPSEPQKHAGPIPENAVLFTHRVVTMGIQGGTRVFKEARHSHADPSTLPHAPLSEGQRLDSSYEDRTRGLKRAIYGASQRHVPQPTAGARVPKPKESFLLPTTWEEIYGTKTKKK